MPGTIAAIILFIIFIISCNKLQPDHPQTGLETPRENLPDESAIKTYADSINQLIPALEKEVSLVYSSGDRSFSITKYMNNSLPVLYIEKVNSGDGNTEKRYYIKKDKLLLYQVSSAPYNVVQSKALINAYFRNNILFYTEQKKAGDNTGPEKNPFIQTGPEPKDPLHDIPSMEDALNQRGKFNLVFDGITEYPKAKYLILSRDELNAFRAVIRVDKEDDLIKELSSNPGRYDGVKLDLKWDVTDDNEAVYKGGGLKRNKQ